MKRRAPVVAILAALPLGAALMVAGCSGDDSRTFQGYVEGTYVYIAPDAMGRLITDAGAELAALPESERPGTVIVAIMTDGMENASKEWTGASIKALVSQQTDVWGWTFMYMGADQDAVEVGTSLGIAADHAVTYGRSKSAAAMGTASRKIAKLRADRLVAPAAPMEAFTAEERRSLAE